MTVPVTATCGLRSTTAMILRSVAAEKLEAGCTDPSAATRAICTPVIPTLLTGGRVASQSGSGTGEAPEPAPGEPAPGPTDGFPPVDPDLGVAGEPGAALPSSGGGPVPPGTISEVMPPFTDVGEVGSGLVRPEAFPVPDGAGVPACAAGPEPAPAGFEPSAGAPALPAAPGEVPAAEGFGLLLQAPAAISTRTTAAGIHPGWARRRCDAGPGPEGLVPSGPV